MTVASQFLAWLENVKKNIRKNNMSLEGMYRKAVRKIRKRDAALAKRGTTAGQETINANLRKEQFSGINPITGHTALSAMYDNDGNPIHSEPKGYTSYGQ